MTEGAAGQKTLSNVGSVLERLVARSPAGAGGEARRTASALSRCRFWENPCPLSGPVFFLSSHFPVSLRLVPSRAEVCRDGTKSQVAGLTFLFFSLL